MTRRSALPLRPSTQKQDWVRDTAQRWQLQYVAWLTTNTKLETPGTETFGRRRGKAASAVKVDLVSPGDERRLRRGVLLGTSHRASALR